MLSWDSSISKMLQEWLTNDYTFYDKYTQAFNESGFYFVNALANVSSILWIWFFYCLILTPIAILA